MSKGIRKTERVIKANLPTKVTLKQPWFLTFAKGPMSLTGLRVFVSLVEAVQKHINLAFNRPDKHIFSGDDFFDNGAVEIKIPLSEVAHPNNYDKAEAAARKLFSLVVEEDYTDPQDGLQYKRYTHVFSSVSVPTYKSGSEGGKRKGYILFTIDRHLADTHWVQTPYIQYVKSVVTNFKTVTTARIYMYMIARVSINQYTWQPTYDDLRILLGCREWNDDKKCFVDKSHEDWGVFRDKILKTAQEEIRTAYDEGNIDVCFDFKPVRRAGAPMQDAGPQSIKFTIYSRQHATPARSDIENRIEEMLRRELNLNEKKIEEILQVVVKHSDESERLAAKIEAVIPTVKAERISHKAKYILACLQQELSDIQDLSSTDSTSATDVEFTPYEDVTPPQAVDEPVDIVVGREIDNLWKLKFGGNRQKLEDNDGKLLFIDAVKAGLRPDYDLNRMHDHTLRYAGENGYPEVSRFLAFIHAEHKREKGIVDPQDATRDMLDHSRMSQQANEVIAAANEAREKRATVEEIQEAARLAGFGVGSDGFVSTAAPASGMTPDQLAAAESAALAALKNRFGGTPEK